MGVFDEMLDMEVRERFLAYKDESISCKPEEVDALRSYLLSDQCTVGILRLKAGDYYFAPPMQFARRKSHSGKKRLVYSLKKEDLMLTQLMTFALRKYDSAFAKNLYSFRSGRRVADLIMRLKSTPGLKNKYILKTDVKSYGDSIDGALLLEQLEALFVGDPEILAFFRWLLTWRTYRHPSGGIFHDGPAVMSGMPLTSFFENLYLSEMDWHFQKKHVLYGRYADDIVLYANTEEQIEEYKCYIMEVMARKKLSLHEEKSMILPPGSTVEVLGMKLTGRAVDIADSSVDKIRWKLRLRASQIMRRKKRGELDDEEAMRRMIFYARRLFFGGVANRHELNWCRWILPLLSKTDGLKKIDAAVQFNIRYVGSGKKSDARYRVRFEKMHELGYRSLVNVYYRRFETDWSTLF